MPTISVIIPTYNRANYITKAINSVLSQSYKDYEIIVVDDGSTDNTCQIIKNYNTKITYIFQENKGPSAARNLGILHANGKYISFLDSDDIWKKHKLRVQIDTIIKNPDIKINYTQEIWIRNGIRINQKKIHSKHDGWIFEQCLPLCIISPSSVIIHREIFNKTGLFDENLIVCEDYDLWLRISADYPIKYIEKPLIIKYGGHSDQLSHQFWGMDRFRVRALQKILLQHNLSDENRTAAINVLKKKCQILANGCFKRDKIDEGKYYQDIIEGLN